LAIAARRSEDVAQESMLRAFRFFRAFTAATPAPGLADRAQRLLHVVEKNRSVDLTTEFNEELHPQPSVSPGNAGHRRRQSRAPHRALEELRALSVKSSSFANSKAAPTKNRAITSVPSARNVRARPRPPAPAARS